MQTIVCITVALRRRQQIKHCVHGTVQILEVPSLAQIAIVFHYYCISKVLGVPSEFLLGWKNLLFTLKLS